MCAENQASVLDVPESPIENCGYVMIDSIEIRNFRCFKHLPPLSFKRFNVIVGESGSGKTSLLEAIFLHGGGSPEIYFRLRAWRGFGAAITFAGTKESWELVFRDMFYDFDVSKVPTITSIDSENGRREVEIFFKNQDSFSLDLKSVNENPFVIKPMVFKWVVNGTVYESSLEREENSQFKVKGIAPVSSVAYFNATNPSLPQAAAAFSGISRRFSAHVLIEEVRKAFPFIEDINIEIVGGEPILHLSTGLSERLPMGDASGGLNKFVVIALGILANPGGAVLVDEIESGFYFKNIPSIWESLMRLCIKSRSQLIVSTHSYEFLKLIAHTLPYDSFTKDFQLLRMYQDQTKNPVVKRVKGTDYLSAIENEFEMR